MAQSERHRRDRRVRETPSPRYAPSPHPEGIAGLLLDSDIDIEILRGRASIAEGLAGRRASAYPSRYARPREVEIADALMAAAASTAGLSLWTLDRKHYPMEDLRLYNPPRT